MTGTRDISDIYREYISCLNRRDWGSLGKYVDEHVCHNDRQFGLSGYRAMLIEDFEAIPDLRFVIDLLVANPPYVACRLWFDCHPKADFLGLAVGGRRVSFAENVIYRFKGGLIDCAWSVVDKSAIERQLDARPSD